MSRAGWTVEHLEYESRVMINGCQVATFYASPKWGHVEASEIFVAAQQAMPSSPTRRFHLQRDEDVSGTSGIGIVAWGCEFQDGSAVLRWNTRYTSTAVYDSMETLEAIHGHSGSTQVVWDDPEP